MHTACIPRHVHRPDKATAHVLGYSEAEVAEEFLSPGFLLLGQHKVPLARRIIGYGVDVVMTDVDTGEACM